MKFHTINSETMETAEIYDEKTLSKIVYDSIKWYKDQTERYKERNEKLHDDAVQVVRKEYEDQIKYLKECLSMSYGAFSSQKEKDAYHDFEKRHMHERLTLAIQSGKAPYLIPTHVGIGTHLEVVCPICGEKEDITDMEVW